MPKPKLKREENLFEMKNKEEFFDKNEVCECGEEIENNYCYNCDYYF